MDDRPEVPAHMERGGMLLGYRYGRRHHMFPLQRRQTLHSGGKSRGSPRFDWEFWLVGTPLGYVRALRG